MDDFMSLMTCLAILDIGISLCLFVTIPGAVVMTEIVMFIVVTVMKMMILGAGIYVGMVIHWLHHTEVETLYSKTHAELCVSEKI